MSLSGDRLGNKFADAIIVIMGASSPIAADETSLRTLMKALGNEIVDEFKNNAETKSSGATAAHASGAAATITDLPGTVI